MNDIIKLAKARGWREHDVDNVHKWMPPHYEKYEKRYAKSWVCLPNPFKDANEDYAVLEWARETWSKHSSEWCDFWFDLPHAGSYKIGDYARAALKVIDHANSR